MKVCKKRRVLYVKGFKRWGSSNSINISNNSKADIAAKEAFQEWFKVGDDDFVFIKNNSSLASLGEFKHLPVSKSMVDTIHDHVEKANMRCKCGKIHVIIIAHSHGAKCVVEAFRSFGKHPGEMKKIHKSTAIITLGPIELVEDDTVKLTCNYKFENDNISNWFIKTPPPDAAPLLLLGPFIRKSETDFDCNCCVSQQPYDEQEKEPGCIPPVLFRTARNVAAGATLVAAGAAGAAVAAGVNTSLVKAHYITDYIKCKQLKNHVVRKFTFL